MVRERSEEGFTGRRVCREEGGVGMRVECTHWRQSPYLWKRWALLGRIAASLGVKHPPRDLSTLIGSEVTNSNSNKMGIIIRKNHKGPLQVANIQLTLTLEDLDHLSQLQVP